MADIEKNSQCLLDLKKQLRELGAACQALNDFCVTGARRIAREPDVEQLRSLATRLKHQLEKAGLSEDRAQSSLVQFDAIMSVGNLLATGIGIAMGKRGLVEGAERLEKIRTSKQHVFGMILICVGQGGLPDDVQVVSISELARIQNRDKSEIIRAFQQRGEWLFSPEVFLKMLDTLIEKLREGELRLPILPKQLPLKLAIPLQVTVQFLLPFKSVLQLPPGGGKGTKK
jgi:hypothetical protein